MAQDKIKGNWKEMMGELKKQWGEKISDDEFTQVDGSREKMVGLLQKKYGYAKDKATEMLEKFLNDSGENIGSLKEKAEALKDKAAQGISDFSEDMSENLQHVKKRAKEYSDCAEEYIQDRPLTAVLVAAGIGMLLGALLLK